jgi:hypothetical protein
METFCSLFFSPLFLGSKTFGQWIFLLVTMYITTMPILVGHLLNWFKAWFKGLALELVFFY